MFGLVRAYKPEMKFKEYETYKAIYCTLCKRIGQKYGILTRLTLSYDMVFMIMLGMSVEDDCPCYEVKRCTSNPLKKCTYCKESNAVIDYCSAVMLLLSNAKIKDNIEDFNFIKRILWRFIKTCYSSGVKKAEKEYPQVKSIVDEYFVSQINAEKQFKGIDASAEPTSLALSKLFEGMSNDTLDARVFNQIGYLLGKWIYIADAVLDYEKDKKNKSFNPFSDINSFDEVKEKANPLLNTCEVHIANDFALLEIKKYKSILENIIFFGFDEVKRNIFKEKK